MESAVPGPMKPSHTKGFRPEFTRLARSPELPAG
jgi:hypothetical protein